jgi:hypothetical protein
VGVGKQAPAQIDVDQQKIADIHSAQGDQRGPANQPGVTLALLPFWILWQVFGAMETISDP